MIWIGCILSQELMMYNDEAIRLLETVRDKLVELNKEADKNMEDTMIVLQDFINQYSITPNDIKKEKNLYHN